MSVIDIPTALTESETTALQAIVKDKYVLEIGALLGYSTVVMAQTAKCVTSIDPHEGYPEDNPRPTWAPYLANLRKHQVQGKVLPIRDTWQHAVKEGLPAPYDVVFMDLTGKYEDTHELLMYLHPEWGWRLKTICVHDCGHPDWPGVDRAVQEFVTFLDMHARFEQIDRMGVFRYA